MDMGCFPKQSNLHLELRQNSTASMTKIVEWNFARIANVLNWRWLFVSVKGDLSLTSVEKCVFFLPKFSFSLLVARSVRELAAIEMVSRGAKEGLIFGKTSSKCWLALKVQSVQSKLCIPYFGFVARSEWECLFALKLVVNSSVQYVNKRHILDTWYHAKPYYNDAWVQDKSYLEFQMLDFDGCPKETTAEVFSKRADEDDWAFLLFAQSHNCRHLLD